jgi:hypothetical protein
LTSIELKPALATILDSGIDAAFLEFFKVVKEDGSCAAARKGVRRTVVPDVRASPFFADAARQAMVAAQAIACQSTPILSPAGRVIGMVSTHFRAPHIPTGGQLKRLDALAAEAAIVIERVQPQSRDSLNTSPQKGTVSRDLTISKVRCPECRSTLMYSKPRAAGVRCRSRILGRRSSSSRTPSKCS